MPARDATEEARPSTLPTTLLWAGIGLVPITVLLLLTGAGGGAQRPAMLLVLLAVLLLGMSVQLRGRGGAVRHDVPHAFLAEIDGLRADIRTEIGSAAQFMNRSHGDQLQVLQENLAMLRGQLDALRAELARVTPATVPPRPGAPASGPHGYGTSTPAATWREPVPEVPVTGANGWAESAAGGWTTTGPTGVAASWTQPGRYGESPYAESPYPANSYGGSRYDEDPYAARGHPVDRSHGEPYVAARHVPHARHGDPGPVEEPPAAAHLSGGVVQHTETVRVTTRQTIVGGSDLTQTGTHAAVSYQGGGGYGQNVYQGGSYVGGSPPPGAQPVQRGWAGTGSWTTVEQAPGQADQERWRSGYQPGADEGWSDVRVGDRWASVHADERGQEIRMGQRRAAVHADGSGARVEVEDRWAALRQEESAPATSWAELMPAWAEPEPEPVRHRHAPAPAGGPTPGTRTRMTAFERFDRRRR